MFAHSVLFVPKQKYPKDVYCVPPDANFLFWLQGNFDTAKHDINNLIEVRIQVLRWEKPWLGEAVKAMGDLLLFKN